MNDMATAHVYPIHDLFDHVVDGDQCWCNPTIETTDPRSGQDYPDDSRVVIHHQLLAPAALLVHDRA